MIVLPHIAPHIAKSEDVLGFVAVNALRKKPYVEKVSYTRKIEIRYGFGKIL
mgnify:CR=1 FL=1